MAWQLIYTSAPRLLEAGRTGFGTVARHRAVSGLLVAAVERFSQFARLPGLDTRRVIHSHRIVTVGASQYHVLSCIRDAGSDYTGRTNHLAHHLIAEAREVQALLGTGITPAEVLLQMAWQTHWQETPRYFDPAQEISLSSFRPRSGSSVWERVTGKREHARLLSAAVSRGCYLVYPPEVDTRALFSESLILTGNQAWQVTLTTSLEPNDEGSDFRWVGMPAASSLRAQMENSPRPVFDLTHPESLPTPEPIPSALSTAPLKRTATSRAVVTIAETPLSSEPATMQSITGWRPTPVSRPARIGLAWWLSITAILCMSVGGIAWWWKQEAPKQQAARQATDLAHRIDDLWREHHLKIPAAAAWLKGRNDLALFTAHERSLQQMRTHLHQPQATFDIARPETCHDDFTELLNAFEAWATARTHLTLPDSWTTLPPEEISREMESKLTQLSRLWNTHARPFSPAPKMPEDATTELTSRLLEHLQSGQRPLGKAAQWQQLLQVIQPGQQIPDWLKQWQLVADLPNSPLSVKERQTLDITLKMPNSPTWLRDLAQERLTNDETKLPEITQVVEPTAPPAPKTLPPESAESLKATHPIFIVSDTPALPISDALALMPALPMAPDMQLSVSLAGQSEAEAKRWKPLGAPGVYRAGFSSAESLEIQRGRILRVPDAEKSWRILGRSRDGVQLLFEMICLTRRSLPPQSLVLEAEPDVRVKQKADSTELTGTLIPLLKRISLGDIQPTYRLNSLKHPDQRFQLLFSDGKARVVTEAKPGLVNSTQMNRRRDVERDLLELKRGLVADEEKLKTNDQSNLTESLKAEANRRLSDGIADKMSRIAAQEMVLRDLIVTTSPGGVSVGLPSGRYALLAIGRDGTFIRLCEINAVSDSAPKTPPPLSP